MPSKASISENMISYLANCVPRLLIDRPIFREIRWIHDEDGKFLLSPFADTELSKRVLQVELA
jgi:hypothetical protein